MKARSMVCADIAQSDEFLSMSVEAMLLYFLILFHADVTGRIYGAARICRGYGFDADALQELYDRHYLLCVDGLTVDCHNWRNNKLDGRLKARMDSFEAYTSGRISFQGEPFKSSYQLNDVTATEERRYNDVTATPNTTQQQPNSNGNSNPTERQTQSQRQSASADTQPGGAKGVEPHPCTCRKCGNEATYTLGPEGTTIRCPECGEYQFSHMGTEGEGLARIWGVAS